MLKPRTPGTLRLHAPRVARPRLSPRKPYGCRAPPPVPDSLLAGLTVGGHGQALARLGVHAARAAAAGAHTCQAALLAALAVAIATPRSGPHGPEPRAGTAGIIRAGELHTEVGAAAAPASERIYFLPLFLLRGLFREVRAPSSAARAPPLATSPSPAGAALKGAMANARLGPASGTVGRARTRSAPPPRGRLHT